jgi:hypothetical protein
VKSGSRRSAPSANTEARLVTVAPSGSSVSDDSSGAKWPLTKTSRVPPRSAASASIVLDDSR